VSASQLVELVFILKSTMLPLYTYTSDQYRSRTGLLNRDRIYHVIGVLSEIWDFPWRLEKTGSVSTLQGGALVVVPVPAAPGIVHCTVRTTVSITFAPAAAVLRILGFWVVRTSVFRDVSLSLAPSSSVRMLSSGRDVTLDLACWKSVLSNHSNTNRL